MPVSFNSRLHCWRLAPNEVLGVGGEAYTPHADFIEAGFSQCRMSRDLHRKPGLSAAKASEGFASFKPYMLAALPGFIQISKDYFC